MQLDIFGYILNLDLSWFYNFDKQSPVESIWLFLKVGGWIPFLIVVLWGLWEMFVLRQQIKFAMKQSYVMLAIDIPRDNLQTPKAVENIFTALAGAQSTPEWHEKTFKGEFQIGYSLEIVSIDGFIQFLIRTPVQFRNLVEASIYAQYPEAEIVEVNDYTKEVNTVFPSEEYNLWGADLDLVTKDYIPIRTYLEFQEKLDNEFKDPMASLLEIMNSIGKGEQLWLQILASPADIGWEKNGLKEVDKMLNIEPKAKPSFYQKWFGEFDYFFHAVGESLLGMPPKQVEEKKKDLMTLLNVPPSTKRKIEMIIGKVDKVCFSCKLRFIYYGRREVFKKGLGVSGIFGALKQFGAAGLNGFKPGKNKTVAKLFMVDRRVGTRQNRLLEAYKTRSGDTGIGRYLLNTEELATLFHFPFIEVKTPLVKKIESRRGFAPIGLPVMDKTLASAEDKVENEKVDNQKVGIIDYDNDYFEKHFAVDKTGLSDKMRKEQILQAIKKEQPETAIIPADFEPDFSSLAEKQEIAKADDVENLPFL
ncbi:MAG: hypothetical protein WCT18_01050 [Patescibacteria group bacterium]